MGHNKTHVLLVEPDSTDHDIYMNMLQYFSYEVTAVNLACTAISILSKRKVQFDLLMANMNSPDSCGFQLLQVAVKMDLPVILMTNNDDAITTMRSLEQGACFCIKKPVTMQMMNYLWRHVISEKDRRPNQKEQSKEVKQYNTLPNEFGEDFMEHNEKENAEGKYKLKKVNFGASQNDSVAFKKKVWVEWNEELHEKFMYAVKHLGEGRCYPRAILELMNVPGLSRMQVASHLQRCRNAKWIPASKRKSKLANATQATPPKNKAHRTKTVSFGSMPRQNNNSRRIQEYDDAINGQELNVGPPTDTNVFRDNRDGSSDNEFHAQLLYNAHEIETLNMGQLGQIFGMDNHEQVFYGAGRDITNDVLDFPNMDSMLLSLPDSQKDSGVDFDGTLEALVLDQLKHNKMPTLTNATNYWSRYGQNQ